jgi:hypothetical protein
MDGICLMKSVNPWTAPPWTRSTDDEPIIRLFLKENNSDYFEKRWNLGFLQETP